MTCFLHSETSIQSCTPVHPGRAVQSSLTPIPAWICATHDVFQFAVQSGWSKSNISFTCLIHFMCALNQSAHVQWSNTCKSSAILTISILQFSMLQVKFWWIPQKKKKVFRRHQEIIKKQNKMEKTAFKGLTAGFIAAVKWHSFLAWGRLEAAWSHHLHDQMKTLKLGSINHGFF